MKKTRPKPLTARARAIAETLLKWDVGRVAKIAAQGYDVTVYGERQSDAAAVVAAGRPPAEWAKDITTMFQALLEVHMVPQQVLQYGVGPVTSEGHPDKDGLRVLAREIGVIEMLREVAPRHWGEGAL